MAVVLQRETLKRPQVLARLKLLTRPQSVSDSEAPITPLDATPETGTVAALLSRAAQQTVAGDVRSAIASLDEALTIDSRHSSVRFALGQSHAALAQWVRFMRCR
jgi:hypothetical protein